MRLGRRRLQGVVVLGLLVLGLAGALASVGKADTLLGWKWPNRIVSGVPVPVASNDRCPAPPNAGDTVLVQINLNFGTTGSESQFLQANADGSWSGPLTFLFFGVPKKATINAQCLDFTGLSATVYAQYAPHLTMLTGS